MKCTLAVPPSDSNVHVPSTGVRPCNDMYVQTPRPVELGEFRHVLELPAER